jgi:hypothetical protein
MRGSTSCAGALVVRRTPPADDGLSFVHLHASDSERSPLVDLPAFRAFQKGIKDRCDEQPVFAELDTVGSFGWFPDHGTDR